MFAKESFNALKVLDLLVNPRRKHTCALLDVLEWQHVAAFVNSNAFNSSSFGASAAADASTCSCQFLRVRFLGRVDVTSCSKQPENIRSYAG